MIGAAIGDIAGSKYEFNNIHNEDFEILSDDTFFTDDTVMTFAVLKSLLEGERNEIKTERLMAKNMQKYGRKWPDAGYGGRFSRWLESKDPKPYDSYGNGSAMRVSPVGWFSHSLSETEKYAEISARVTHNHPEGIKGAKAVASGIFLAREGRSKEYIRNFISKKYGYDFSFTLDDIRESFTFDETCQGTVPVAFEAFFEAESFEDTLRKTVALGGDCDTTAAIACSIAEGFYPIPENLEKTAIEKLPEEFKQLLKKCDKDLGFAHSPFKKRDILDYTDYMLSNPATMRQEIRRPESEEKIVAPIYNDIFFNFINDVKKSDHMRDDYKELFAKHGIKQYEDMIIELPDASELLLDAMLTYIIEAERYVPGNVAWAAENGIIGDILQNLEKYAQI